MSPVTLVFPSSMMQSHAFTRLAKARGDRVIAASSVKADETAKHYDHWVYLPSMYDPGFGEALADLIASEAITHFYTPHMVVYLAVKALVENQALAVILCDSPIATLQGHYCDVFDHARDAAPFIEAISGKAPSPTLIASLFHYGEQIYGQTSETKIAAMAAVCADAPKGDVIEIGSAWGRSAFVLATLATHYDIGNLLCIDPWQEETAHQSSDQEHLTEAIEALDWEATFQSFLVHMMPFGARVNYVRTTSAKAVGLYRKACQINSPEFGTTAYTGRAAVIHIDGNHGFECIDEDCRLWRPQLLPGGWLIIDDYVWEHGTGPKQVGDKLLAIEADQIESAFTSGKALFVKFRKV